jgi:hypothetical protein
MCRRRTTDPLLSIVSRDDFTLLRNMRTGVDALATWVDFSGQGPFEPVGELSELIEGGLPDLPSQPEDRPDIENKQTNVFEAGIGLRFLAPFLAVVGLSALTQLRTRIEGMRHAYVRIRVGGVKQWSISLATLSQELGAAQIAANQGRLLTDGRRVAFASHVIKAQSIFIETVRRSGRGMNLGAEFAFAADADVDASFRRVSESEVSFTGSNPVTFGVRLYELLVDSERRALRLDRAPGYDALDEPGSVVQGAQPLLLDGPDGDLVGDL